MDIRFSAFRHIHVRRQDLISQCRNVTTRLTNRHSTRGTNIELHSARMWDAGYAGNVDLLMF